jgi:hypothetical protein
MHMRLVREVLAGMAAKTQTGRGIVEQHVAMVAAMRVVTPGAAALGQRLMEVGAMGLDVTGGAEPRSRYGQIEAMLRVFAQPMARRALLLGRGAGASPIVLTPPVRKVAPNASVSRMFRSVFILILENPAVLVAAGFSFSRICWCPKRSRTPWVHADQH